MIRFKNVRGEAMDKAVDELIEIGRPGVGRERQE